MGKTSKKKKGPGKGSDSGRAGLENKPGPSSSKTASPGFTIISVLAAIVTFLIYLPSLQNEFVNWDDDLYVYENPFIRAMDVKFFKSAFFDFHVYNWHPLTWISHALDYAVWGLNPLGHHLTNVVLHALNTFIVVFLAARLIQGYRKTEADKGASSPSLRNDPTILIAAAVTGLLFGLHPLHVESVAWVSERKDLLCGLFYLLSIMSYAEYGCSVTPPSPSENSPTFTSPYLKGRTGGVKRACLSGRQGARGPYLSSLLFFILSLLSKPMAVSLPLVLLVLDWYPFNRIQSIKTALAAFVEKIPFIVLSFISSVLTIMAQRSAIEMRDFIPLSIRLLVAASSLAAYLLKMILPLNLVPYYPYPKNVSLFSFEYLLPCVLLIGIIAVSVSLAKKRRLWIAIWAYYGITLLPVLGIVQVGGQAMADRYSYLPSLGPFFVMGLMTAAIYEKAADVTKWKVRIKIAGIVIAISALTSLSYATVRQIGVWKNSFVLWNYVIKKEPGRTPFAHNNLGMAYQSKGLLDLAIEQYQASLLLKPDDTIALYNLGNTYRSKGRFDLAVEQYQKALTLKPDFVSAHTNLGNIYRSTGQFDLAIEQYRQALSLQPEDAVAHYNLANAYQAKGLFDMAITQYQEALTLRQDFASAYINLGNTYQYKGQIDLAIEHYRKASTLQPDNALAHYNLGISYAKKGMKKEAIEELKTTLQIQPDHAEGRQALESLTR